MIDVIRQYSLIAIALVLGVILLSVVIDECLRQNKLLKWQISLSFVNLFILIVISFLYKNYILNDSYKILYAVHVGYISIFFIFFAVFVIKIVSSSNQKASSYEQFIHSLSNTSFNVYYICDKKDRIKEISESFLEELGLKREEVIGKKAFDVFDLKIRFTRCNDAEVTNKTLREYYKTFSTTCDPDREISRELHFQNYNGQTIVFNLIEKPIFVNKKYKGRLNIGQKITDQSLMQVERELKDSNNNLTAIQSKFIAMLELTDSGMFFNQIDDDFIWVNDVMVDELGLSSNTISTVNFMALIEPSDAVVYKEKMKNLTPENPNYSITYRFNVGGKYEFIKEEGKRIYEGENVVVGYAKKMATAYYEKTGFSEIDSLKTVEDMGQDLTDLFADRRFFQLVCLNLTSLPDINKKCGRGVGNMMMNEYIKTLKTQFLTESSNIYRASGLVFYFTITDNRKMDMLKRMITADENSMNICMNYGSMKAELKVNFGIAESNSDAMNKDEIIKRCNEATNIALNPNYKLCYAYYKDIKSFRVQ